MKKMRKGKKMLLIGIIALIAIVLLVIIINKIVNKEPDPLENPEETPVIQLQETTYSGMEVRNIVMEYRKQYDETVISMDIYNTTDKKVEKQHFDAVLMNAKGDILGQKRTYIQSLEVGEQHGVTVAFKGDLTSTTQIKLIEK